MTNPAPERQWRGRSVLYGLGAATVGYGVWGMIDRADRTRPASAALRFGGGVIGHDVLLAPVALLVSAAVSLVALLLVLGLGGAVGNPSANALPYARDLALLLAVVWGTTAALVVTGALRDRRARRRAPARDRSAR